MAEAEGVFAPRSVLLPGRRSLMVRLTCNGGMRPALLNVLNSSADGLSEEPGTELFVVSLDPDDETILWLYEIFKYEDTENEHRASSGFQSLMQSMPLLFASPPAVLRTVPLRMSMQGDILSEDWDF